MKKASPQPIMTANTATAKGSREAPRLRGCPSVVWANTFARRAPARHPACGLVCAAIFAQGDVVVIHIIAACHQRA